MSFIDEAAKEINVKIVWYSAAPGTAATLVRFVGARTRPDLKREEKLTVQGGWSVTHLQFVPAALGTLRGYSTRFHLYAIEGPQGFEPDDLRLLLFRGADGCVFIGGPGEAAALARVDAVYAAQRYANIPIVFGAEGASPAEAVARGRALGFPDADAFAIDPASGGGVFDAFKVIAKKMLMTLTGSGAPSRPTPAPGTVPLAVPAAPPAAPTLEQVQEGLDPWQRAYHAAAIWVTGVEVARFTPSDVPAGMPAHCVHVLRPMSADGFTLMTDGISRDRAGVELRADTAQHGWQIAQALSMLGRLWFAGVREGLPPWRPFDLVTTAEQPLFGFSHFALLPAGVVRVGEGQVSILRAVPISPAEHAEIAGKIVGEQLAAWFSERRASILQRWLPALQRQHPFDG